MPLGTVATVQNFKKKKRQNASPKLHCRWIVGTVVWTIAKHCSGIVAFYIVNRFPLQTSLNTLNFS